MDTAPAGSDPRRIAEAEVLESYVTGLERLLASPDEAPLAAAYFTGRLGIRRRLGVLDMVGIHRQALARIDHTHHGNGSTARQATDYLAEALAPFEMVHRAVSDSVDQLRALTQTLEAQASELRTANEKIRRLLQQRSAFLAEASREFSRTLDLHEILRALAWQPVPLLADWCLVLVGRRDGKLRLASAHFDPARAGDLDELVQGLGLAPGASTGPGRVVRTGLPELEADLSQEQLGAVFSPELLPAVSRLGVRSWLVLPITARGRVLGTLMLVRGAGRASFEPEEVALAEEFAGRAAFAVDNARLYQEAREAVRVRELFLSVASHELNTPLTALLLRLHQLEARLKREHHADAELASKALRYVDRLRRLVVDLLDVSRIQGGRLTLQLLPMSLPDLARALVSEFEPTSPRHHFVLDLDADARVLGDRERLDQVLTNLLTNAVKYSPEGGDVRVTVRARDGEVELSVQDSGIGVPADQLEHLFERFFRGDNATVERFGGLGLGLYIAHDIVARHHGRITVESRLGAGSTFHVILPRHLDPPADREPDHA